MSARLLKLTGGLVGLGLACLAGVAVASAGAAAHRKAAPRNKLLGVTCVQTHCSWAPATEAARHSRGDTAVCRYLAAPAGRVRLARAAIRHRGR